MRGGQGARRAIGIVNVTEDGGGAVSRCVVAGHEPSATVIKCRDWKTVMRCRFCLFVRGGPLQLRTRPFVIKRFYVCLGELDITEVAARVSKKGSIHKTIGIKTSAIFW